MIVKVSGLDAVRNSLASLAIDLQMARQAAETKMAFEIKEAEALQMVADLDRPTPWALGSLRYKPAGKPGLVGAPTTDGAAVYFESSWGYTSGLDPEEYLGVQVLGGQTAGPKRSEVRLQDIGLMRRDQVWVPAPGVKLDAYGNVPGAVISAMLSDLGANPYALRKDRSCCKNFTWIGQPPNDVKGILARIGMDWLPFLFFVPRVTTYKKRFDFYGRADAEAKFKFPKILNEYIAKAIAKAAK